MSNSPSHERVSVTCACGKLLFVRAQIEKSFRCKYCGQKLRLSFDSDADFVNGQYEVSPRFDPTYDPVAHGQPVYPATSQHAVPPQVNVQDVASENTRPYWQKKSGRRESRREKYNYRKTISTKDTIELCGAIFLLGIAAVLFAYFGLPGFINDFERPDPTKLVTLTDRPVMLDDDSERERNKCFEFSLSGREFIVEQDYWEPELYQNLRDAVNGSEIVTVDVLKEERGSVDRFWSFTADGTQIDTYQRLSENFRTDRGWKMLWVLLYGAPLVVLSVWWFARKTYQMFG